MTDKQMHFIAWLITAVTDKCQTIEEVKEINAEIRKHSAELAEEEKAPVKKAETVQKKADSVSLW